jgi:hypothetical protein
VLRVSDDAAMTSDRNGKQATRARKSKWGEIQGGRAFVIPWSGLHHENGIRLSPRAIKLLFDLGRQYSGNNNGYLCPAWSVMRNVGWRSSESLFLAIRELEHYGWIAKTKQGGRNAANLYRLTWFSVDFIARQPTLDLVSSTRASNEWNELKPAFDPKSVLTSKAPASKKTDRLARPATDEERNTVE